MKEYIKPSVYAKIKGCHYRTVMKHYHAGYIEGYKDKYTSSIFIKNPLYKEETLKQGDEIRVVLYARVSSSSNKKSLDGQIERMNLYSIAKGYTVIKEIKEIASGLNDNRRKLNSILEKDDWDILLVEHKDRLTRFGFNYFNILEKNNQRIEVINKVEEKDEDLMNDFISIVTSFCGRIYGRKRKEKIKKIIEEINGRKD